MKIAETCSKWIPLEFSISYANEYARSNEKSIHLKDTYFSNILTHYYETFPRLRLHVKTYPSLVITPSSRTLQIGFLSRTYKLKLISS